MHTVIDTFVRALPRALGMRTVVAGLSVVVKVIGNGGGAWSAECAADGWRLWHRALPSPTAEVLLDSDTAWRLWTRAIDPSEARPRVTIHGDPALGDAVLNMVSIIR